MYYRLNQIINSLAQRIGARYCAAIVSSFHLLKKHRVASYSLRTARYREWKVVEKVTARERKLQLEQNSKRSRGLKMKTARNSTPEYALSFFRGDSKGRRLPVRFIVGEKNRWPILRLRLKATLVGTIALARI